MQVDYAAQFEAATAAYLNENRVAFITENEQQKRASLAARTVLSNSKSTEPVPRAAFPDFLLKSELLINGEAVNWIDCKAYYGSHYLTTQTSQKGFARLPINKIAAQV